MQIQNIREAEGRLWIESIWSIVATTTIAGTVNLEIVLLIYRFGKHENHACNFLVRSDLNAAKINTFGDP